VTRIAAALAAVALGASAAAAQPAAGDCVAIQDKLQRLDCYDRLHGRTELPAAPGSTVPAAPAQPASPDGTQPPRPDTSLAARWDLDGKRGPLFYPRVYRPVYVLLADWTDRTNPQPSSPSPGHTVESPLLLRPIEAKYQISLKSKFWQFDNGMSLWGAYTQSSRWQVYNAADSRPFRETNYEPELILVKPLDVAFAGGTLRMATIALNHQSNGRALPLSRSWNRIVGSLVYEKGEWTVEARPWWRLPESAASDDNPDISDYAGRGELRVARRFGEHFLSLQLRHSLRFGSRSHGSAQLDYVFPMPGVSALHGQLQLFSGYAESMIDYNVRQTRVGIGVTIGGWQ
jgi:phospholipase A1